MKDVELKIKKLVDEKSKEPFDNVRNINLVDDLSIDSVALIELIVQIEDDFDIIFEDDEMDISIIGNLDQLIKLVESKL